ncbi:hypothetical protein [Candidatus Enterococcus mansonii]|uniref:hypothetical protein n=1 Tax=Candidatus Enterococcus mansonii TaxID=1834181 RepID=UPI0030142DC0
MKYPVVNSVLIVMITSFSSYVFTETIKIRADAGDRIPTLTPANGTLRAGRPFRLFVKMELFLKHCIQTLTRRLETL